MDFDNTLSKSDILPYLRVREELTSLPYEELEGLQRLLKKSPNLPSLKKFIDSIVSERISGHGVSMLSGLLLNIAPYTQKSPFYYSKGADPKISSLKSHAERLYFYNLNMDYKGSELTEVNDNRYINQDKVRSLREIDFKKADGADRDSMQDARRKARLLWSYQLKDDRLQNFLIGGQRQWIKKYEEEIIEPVVYKNAVILRNEYRLFCLDINTKDQLWSLSCGNDEREFYQTFRHPHQNSYGYELLLENDTIFAELNGRLLAVDIKNILSPKTLWNRGIGEWRLCAKPILNKDTIVVGLVNAKRHIWICGFDRLSGQMRWSSYVGLSSSLSPVCLISEKVKNYIFVATNEGFIACIDSDSGEIAWIRRYRPKKFHILKYWIGKGDRKKPIEYDTQFLEIGKDGRLYYKGRESDYLYILDPQDGALRQEVLIDPDRCSILRVSDGKAIFLDKQRKDNEAGIELIDLDSGKVEFKALIGAGNLRGVLFPDADTTLFKIGDKIFLFSMQDGISELKDIAATSESWLSYYAGNILFTASNDSIYCYRVEAKTKSPQDTTDPAVKKFLADRTQDQQVLSELKAISSSTEDKFSEKARLIDIVENHRISPEDLAGLVINLKGLLRKESWQDLVGKIHSGYKDMVIVYKGVSLRFGNLLCGLGYNKPYPPLESSPPKGRQIISEETNKGIIKTTGKIFKLLDIDIVKGSESIDFFLLLNFDQLLCIGEEGQILWNRRIRCWGKIKIYLFDDVLVINDLVNIIGIDSSSGKYIWSLSYDEKAQIPFLPWANMPVTTEFYGDTLLACFGNSVYLIEPSTGYCKKTRQLDEKFEISAAFYDKEGIFLLDDSQKILLSLSADLSIKKDLTLNCQGPLSRLVVIDKYILLKSNKFLYAIDKDKLLLSQTMEAEDCLIEKYKDNLLLISPLNEVRAYKAREGSYEMIWKVSLGDLDKNLHEYNRSPLHSQDYFLNRSNLYIPFKKGAGFFIGAIDLEKGREGFSVRLDGTEGLFYKMSNAVSVKDNIYFIFSTTCREVHKEANLIIEAKAEPDQRFTDMTDSCNDANTRIVYSRFIGVDTKKGAVVRNEELPFSNTVANRLSSVTTTDKDIIFVSNGELLEIESIDEV